MIISPNVLGVLEWKEGGQLSIYLWTGLGCSWYSKSKRLLQCADHLIVVGTNRFTINSLWHHLPPLILILPYHVILQLHISSPYIMSSAPPGAFPICFPALITSSTRSNCDAKTVERCKHCLFTRTLS